MQFRPLLHLLAAVAMASSTLLHAATPSFSFSAPQFINLPQEFGYDQIVADKEFHAGPGESVFVPLQTP